MFLLRLTSFIPALLLMRLLFPMDSSIYSAASPTAPCITALRVIIRVMTVLMLTIVSMPRPVSTTMASPTISPIAGVA